MTEEMRLSACLIAIANAKSGVTADAIRTVAYDVALNLITPDVVEHQLERRSVQAIPAVPAPTSAAPTEDEFVAIVERLQGAVRTWKGSDAYGRSLDAELHMALQYRRLDLGLRAIRRAAARGDVCDDVAWFDTVTTLLEYCSILLGDDVDLGAIAAPLHPSRRPKPPPHQRPVLNRRKMP